MAKLNVGVIIGRFHVPELHAGHLHLFDIVNAASDRVVVLLGVSALDGRAAEYPLTFAQRESMYRHSLASVTGTRQPPVVLPLLDRDGDDVWSQQIDDLLDVVFPGENITLFGGRDSFTEHYKGSLKVERISTLPVIDVAGRAIRAAVKERNSADFLLGQIHSLQKQYPHAYPTVDMALLRNMPAPDPADGRVFPTHPEVLLIQRADTGRWCFPGGFVDPTDASIDAAAAREMHEELGLVSEGGWRHIGSCRIDDWRYRGSRDKILTSLYAGQYAFGNVVQNYDEVQDYRWVGVPDAAPSYLAKSHLPLWDMLNNHLLRLSEVLHG